VLQSFLFFPYSICHTSKTVHKLPVGQELFFSTFSQISFIYVPKFRYWYYFNVILNRLPLYYFTFFNYVHEQQRLLPGATSGYQLLLLFLNVLFWFWLLLLLLIRCCCCCCLSLSVTATHLLYKYLHGVVFQFYRYIISVSLEKTEKFVY